VHPDSPRDASRRERPVILSAIPKSFEAGPRFLSAGDSGLPAMGEGSFPKHRGLLWRARGSALLFGSARGGRPWVFWYHTMACESTTILVERVPGSEDLPLPGYATPGSSGIDLLAAVETDIVFRPGERKLVSTGIRVAIPEGFEAQVRPRSGLALRHGIGIVNSPGTIDSDYRGVIQVILVNHGDEPFIIRRGDRIAQLVIAPVVRAVLVETDSLPQTARNDGGFGHTGVRSELSSPER